MAEPLRIMSLHALAYCERLFYLEEVEEMRVADERVYAGRRLHVELEKKEGRTRKGNVVVRPEVVRRRKNWVKASSTALSTRKCGARIINEKRENSDDAERR